jgi:hypothetical protein
MSWGFPEGQSVLANDEALYDQDLTTPAGHQGVTFVASAGDYGSAMPEYPAFSPNVVAIGGTSLTLNADSTYNSETGWGYYSNVVGQFIGSGGGVSQYEAEPAFQQGVQSTGNRTIPDVSFLADPATGAWIADAYNLPGGNPWEIAGGTSLSAPSWAGLIALVDQGRAIAGEPTLGSAGAMETQTALYNLPQSDYNVISSGSNGDFTAQPGYNLVTGLGTPIANRLVTDLIAWSGALNTSGNTVPAWQGSYQDRGSGDGSGSYSVDSAFVFHAFDFQSIELGNFNDLFSPAHADAIHAGLPAVHTPRTTPVADTTLTAPSGDDSLAFALQGLRFEGVAAATTKTPTAVAWASAPMVSSSTASPASLSVFSQGGPLVGERWSESPFARLSFPSFIDPQSESRTARTPGLDGDDSVLVGGAGTDILIGGLGRDMLIGGFGNDKVIASDGGSSLIASGTDSDAHALALRSILAEWASSDGNSVRMNDILGTGGMTGLNDHYPLDSGAPQDNGVSDRLWSGETKDWFLPSLDGQGGGHGLVLEHGDIETNLDA